MTTPADTFRERLKEAARQPEAAARLHALRALTGEAHGHVETIQLDQLLGRVPPEAAADAGLVSLRLAVLASATVNHLVPGLRVAALRHGFLARVHAGGYGQYRQELLAGDAALDAFAPEVLLLSLSARGLVDALPADAGEAAVAQRVEAEIAELRSLWAAARRRFGAALLQQTWLDVFEPLFGSFDRLAPAAPANVVDRLNARLAEVARDDGVALVDVARAAARDGLAAWHDGARWLQGKMEIAPQAAPRFGELALRVVAAQRGRSRKCLVLDLDNTLWGGVVGEVGPEGLVLGEGSATGEAHLALQRWARRLKQRGVILAVCSKNDAALAQHAFATHPEMLLKPEDVACFVANWGDKAANLVEIARRLNIGLDALVFVDDHPAERARVREALPEVAVPELPEDPADWLPVLARHGWFEAVAFTADDAARAADYAAGARREALREGAGSVNDFLQGLAMTVAHGRVGALELERATQLVNKTNQFNTTARRCTADELAALAADARHRVLWFRLADRFGDSGLVSVMVLRAADGDAGVLDIDAWVMSCRVFGRQLEDEALNVAVGLARVAGAHTLRGRIVATARNGVVHDLYARLGFAPDGDAWTLALDGFAPRPTHIRRQDDTT